VPIPIACPGCGWTENGPENLMGKRLKCKRCKQGFVVGGGSVAPKPSAKPAAKPRASAPSSDSDLDFGEPEMRPSEARRRISQKSMTPVLMLFLFSFLAGGGGTAGYLWYTKEPPPAADSSSAKTEKPLKFTWVDTSSSSKPPKEVQDLPFDEKDFKDLKPGDKP
jgi:hypothetical protein